jgi:hypothetical protein
VLTALLFLVHFNHVLQRLAAMLPDETLRDDTRVFTSMNLNVMLGVVVILAIIFGLARWNPRPAALDLIFQSLEDFRHWLTLFPILVPVALTMTLVWKIKEALLASVFEARE